MHFLLSCVVILIYFKLILCFEIENIQYNETIHQHASSKDEFPWQISLQYRIKGDLHHICGGTILNEQWAVTAAHCFENVNYTMMSIMAGAHTLYEYEHNRQPREILRIVLNNFDMPTFYNDIALVKVYPAFDFSQINVKPICLPDTEQKFTGMSTATGWGKVSESGSAAQTLQKVNLPIIERDLCEQKYTQKGFSRYFNKCQMCTEYPEGTKDACQGDSGGPLICKGSRDQHYLCGIVSWGIGCARKDHPGVYTLTSCHVPWIEQVINTDYIYFQ